MKAFFLSAGRPLHEAVIAAFGDTLNICTDLDALFKALAGEAAGLVILDAEYETISGYAIAEMIHAQFGKTWRVHLISNEASIGEEEKAAYAGVDRLFIVPRHLEELTKHG